MKQKITLLKDLQYILPDKTLSAKGKLASKMHGIELQIGEIFESGILTTLSAKKLAILACALSYEPRKRERKPRLNKDIERLRKEIMLILKDVRKKEKAKGIYPQSKYPYFHLSPAIILWFEGARFWKMSEKVPQEEGEIVRYFRMGLQILKELRKIAFLDKSVREKISIAIKRMDRDQVNAEKQMEKDLE